MLRRAVLVAGVAVADEHASKQPTVGWPCVAGAVQFLVVLLVAGLDQPGGLHLPIGWTAEAAEAGRATDPVTGLQSRAVANCGFATICCIGGA